jgi:hypothetical protein
MQCNSHITLPSDMPSAAQCHPVGCHGLCGRVGSPPSFELCTDHGRLRFFFGKTEAVDLNWLKVTPWLKSVIELYRPSDRRLSAKLVPTFADGGVAWSVWRIPYGHNLCFLDRTSLEHSHKVLHKNTRTKHFTRSLARSTSLEHSHKVLH